MPLDARENLFNPNPPDPSPGITPKADTLLADKAAEGEDRNFGGPPTPAICQHRTCPVHGREKPKQPPDNTPRSASAAHGAAPVLAAQRPALDVHPCCSQGGVPSEPAGKTEWLVVVGGRRRNGALEHGG